jgi:hypothetical protein
MPSDERDRQLERALARHMSAAKMPEADCPDAEILAAYHERTLSLDEMSRWKEHFAKCETCQVALSLMEATDNVSSLELVEQEAPVAEELSAASAEPEVLQAAPMVEMPVFGSAYREIGAAPQAKKKRSTLWWLVPVGALAAAALVYVGVFRKQEEMKPASNEIAENREPAMQNSEQSAEPAPQNQPETQTPPASTATGSADTLSNTVPPPESSPRAIEPSVNKPLQLHKDAERDVYGSKKENPVPETAMQDRAASANLPAPPISAGDMAAKTAPSAELQRRSMATPAPNSPVSNMGQVIDRNRTDQNDLKQDKALDATGAASQLNAFTGSSASVRKIASANRSVIVAPDNRQVWIAEESGSVLHSSDAGRTWNPQHTGASADLLTGAAPSSSVVWIVGRTGTILLTTDVGKHWKRIPSPITEDLGGIHAADAAHATVWDAKNRKSFETQDGGAHWALAANE